LTDDDPRISLYVNRAPVYDIEWVLNLSTKTGSRSARCVRSVFSYSIPPLGTHAYVPIANNAHASPVCEIAQVVWNPYAKSLPEMFTEKKWVERERFTLITELRLPNIGEFDSLIQRLLDRPPEFDIDSGQHWTVDLGPVSNKKTERNTEDEQTVN